MLICRCPGEHDVRLVVGTFVNDFAGKRYIGAPYVGSKIMQREDEPDTLGRPVRTRLSYRHDEYSNWGLARLLTHLIEDVNAARKAAA